jgi:hypothetical protein
MASSGHLAADEDVDVVLVGGPSDLPAAARTQRVGPEDVKVKLIHRGGYEHFERERDASGSAPVVFRWTSRTRIAE